MCECAILGCYLDPEFFVIATNQLLLPANQLYPEISQSGLAHHSAFRRNMLPICVLDNNKLSFYYITNFNFRICGNNA